MSASEPRDAGGTMRVPRFVEILSGLRLLSVEDLAAVQQAWADRATVDAQLLAKDLVQQDKLTRYQAAAIYQNKTRGLVLNDYVVLDKLGSGGMGNVYKARHRNSGDTVAIKVMSSASMRSPDNVKRFQREAEMAARLNHPNIVRGIEAGSADGLHYFAMEFVDGLDLSNYLKKQGPIPYQQALQCITQAALGLDFAHAQGVVHRDIKPGNLFLCKDGTIKLLDLGLARLSDPSETATAAAHEGLTQTGQVMGTVDYMAPEQALNTRHADARSDIYSLGCALYRLITGEIPFDGQSMVEKILAHREQPVPSVRAKFAEIPLGVDLVLSRMLAKRPDDRYQTMREVAQALQNAPKMTESVGVLPTPAASGAVAPGASIVPAAMPVAVSIPIALTIPQAAPEPSNSFSFGASVAPVGRESSRIKPRSKAGWLWGALAVGVVICGGVAAFVFSSRGVAPPLTTVANETANVAKQSLVESPGLSTSPPASKSEPPKTSQAKVASTDVVQAAVSMAAVANNSASTGTTTPSTPTVVPVAISSASPSPINTTPNTPTTANRPESPLVPSEGLATIPSLEESLDRKNDVYRNALEKVKREATRELSILLTLVRRQVDDLQQLRLAAIETSLAAINDHNDFSHAFGVKSFRSLKGSEGVLRNIASCLSDLEQARKTRAAAFIDAIKKYSVATNAKNYESRIVELRAQLSEFMLEPSGLQQRMREMPARKYVGKWYDEGEFLTARSEANSDWSFIEFGDYTWNDYVFSATFQVDESDADDPAEFGFWGRFTPNKEGKPAEKAWEFNTLGSWNKLSNKDLRGHFPGDNWVRGPTRRWLGAKQPVEMGRPYDLKLEFKGKEVPVRFNGQEIARSEHEGITNGRIAFVYNLGKGRVRIWNIEVIDLQNRVLWRGNPLRSS